MAVKGRQSPRDAAQTAHTTENSQGMGLEPGAHQCSAVESAPLHPGPSRDGLGQQSPDRSV